ncbi:10259_t:CDS:1, partial [Scutellospora calospora]
MSSPRKHEKKELHLRGEYSTKLGTTEIASQTISAVQTVGDAITPFVPLFTMVTNILGSMITIYDNAKCNEKICGVLLDR